MTDWWERADCDPALAIAGHERAALRKRRDEIERRIDEINVFIENYRRLSAAQTVGDEHGR